MASACTSDLPDSALRCLLASAPMGLAVLDDGLRFVWLNCGFASIGSMAVNDCVGQKITDVMPELALELAEPIRRLLEGREKRLYLESVASEAAGGEQRYWTICGFPVTDDIKPLIGLVANEISDRKQAEDKVARERALFDTVLEQMPAGVIVAEAPGGRVVRMNRRVRQILESDYRPSNLEDWETVKVFRPGGERCPTEEFAIFRALQAGEMVANERHTFVTESGRPVALRTNAAPIRNERNEIIAAVAVFQDVTDTDRAYAGLQASEERLRLLIENVNDFAIYMLDATGRIANWNIGAERVTGYRAEDVVGRPHSIFYPPGDILVFKPDYALRVAAERGRFTDEGWRIRKDGSRFWASASYTALRDCDGELRGFSKILADRTEQKVAEETSREALGRLWSTLESISDAFCALDREWRFTYLNAEAARLFGKNRSDVIGRPMAEVFPDAEGTRLQRELQRALQSPVGAASHEFQDRAGRYFEVRAYPSSFGVSMYLRDVTERKNAELSHQFLAEMGNALSQSLDYEETLEKLVEVAVPRIADWCVALVVDESGHSRAIAAHPDPDRKALASQLFERMPMAAINRGPGKVMRAGVPDLMPVVGEAELLQLACDEEGVRDLRRLRVASMAAVPLRARGRLLGAMMFCSERPHRYRDAEREFYMEVGRRAALAVDNALLFSQAKEAIAARESLVAIASHDLRQPIQNVRLRAEMLIKLVQSDGGDLDKVREGLRAIERQVDRLTDLTGYLLEMSRIASGEISVHLEPVDISAVVRGVADSFQRDFEAARSSAVVESAAPVVGRWDRRRLEQVSSNILANAIKHSDGKPVEIAVTRRNGMVRVSVHDHGPGVPVAERRRIFEKYTQARGTSDGFGLGLWIARRIVEKLGGRIGVESEPSEGSTFWFELPTRAR